jgi:inorganic pyrophosphatase|uniref:Uncharacterized protein n=1 Tax=Myoviridae sp. ctzwE5 TaxID=2825214 RepID=A0A8S5PVL0_9CAUD|nr:MAG TPA: hypothetical protein [Myoviridae sp. ctzwE5]
MRGVTIVKDGRTTNRQKMKDKIREEKIECQETNLMAEIDQVLDKYLEEAKKECETYRDLENKIRELEWKATWGKLGPYAGMIAGILKKKIEEEKKGLKIKK